MERYLPERVKYFKSVGEAADWLATQELPAKAEQRRQQLSPSTSRQFSGVRGV